MTLKNKLLSLFLALSASAYSQCPIPENFQERPALAINIDAPLPEDNIYLLNLWAIWCAPCREELTLLEKKYQEQPFPVLAINLNDQKESAQALLETLNIEALPIYYSDDNALLEKLQALGLPYTALIKSQQIIAIHYGVLKDLDPILEFINCEKGKTNEEN